MNPGLTRTDSDNWPFDQGPNVGAITIRQVLELGDPIRHVVHYGDDDSWAFLCGTTDNLADYRIVHIQHLLTKDESLREIADLPPGWSAWRENGESAWERFQEDLD
ncbi:MAG TPA: hypothetical protein VN476_18235 [Pyrinomonadaceae bacterium]|nr:hypothetical protein [Pyrinomonadaceae bacterium]